MKKVVMNAEFENKKKAVKTWLEKVIKNKTALEYLGKDEYNSLDIKLCGISKEVHIYKGLEMIAFYLGKTVTYDPNWMKDKGMMSFNYKGYEIFEIWDKES